MTWLIFATTSTFLIGGHYIASKKILVFENALRFLAVLSVAQFFVLIPLIPFIEIPTLEGLFFIVLQSVLLTIGLLLQFYVLKKLPVSTAAPLNSLMPLFLYSYAFFILGETLSNMQLTGFLILVAGAYLLSFSPKDILLPVKKIFQSEPEQRLALALMLLAAVAMMDKMIFMRGVSVLSLLFFSQMFLAINSVLALLFTEREKGLREAFGTKGAWVLFSATVKNLGNLAYLTAVSMAPVSLVLPFRQMANFVAAFFGGKMFKEKNIARKATASIIMVIGIILITI